MSPCHLKRLHRMLLHVLEHPREPRARRFHRHQRLQEVHLGGVRTRLNRDGMVELTARTPSNDIDGLCVSDEGREVGDFSLFAVLVDSPELPHVSFTRLPLEPVCLLGHYFHLQQLLGALCHGARSEQSRLARCHCAMQQAMVKPSW